MLSDMEYHFLATMLEREYGIDLAAASPEIIEAKIGKYRERHNLASTAECIDQIRREGSEAANLGDVIYSQRTCFNRSPEHFRFVVEALRRRPMEQRGAGPVRVWCAACSTGQEAYTIAIYLLEHFDGASPEGFQIVASDCSRTALQRAEAGRYHPLDVRELEPIGAERYFTEDAGVLTVKPDLRSHLEFRVLNLVTSEYGFDRELDFVFLRNALDFHSAESRLAILRNVHRTLKPGGHLVLGDCPRLAVDDVSAQGYEALADGCYRTVGA